MTASARNFLGARNRRDGSYCLQPGERLSWGQEIAETDLIASSPVSGERLSWGQEITETDHCGETDHRRDGSYCLQSGERQRRIIAKTDLIASSPVSASPGGKKSPKRIIVERRIIAETDLIASNPVRATLRGNCGETDHRRDGSYCHCRETDLSTANPVSASPGNKKYPGPRRIIVEKIFPPPTR